MNNVVILGAGGHALVISDIIKASGDSVVALLDDDPVNTIRSGCISDYNRYSDCKFIIGIGNADVRERLAQLDVNWHIAIHPTAIISPSAKLGEGTVVMPNAVINARASVGNHCIINTGAIIEHDNKIFDYAHISVGAKTGGNVSIGRKTWVGIGATIKNGIEICSECVIGAGATVVKDIEKSGVYIGVPAKPMK